MNPFKILGEKSWIPQPVGTDFSLINDTDRRHAGKIALNFFIAVISVVFFLFTITFLTRSQIPDFQALAGEPWQPLTDATQLWVNTGALLLSSLALHWSQTKALKGSLKFAQLGSLASVIFALVFIVGQILVWQRLNELGYFMTTHPAASYFYLLTAIHGLHLLGGLCVLFVLLTKFGAEGKMETVISNLKLCTTYWHFLLVIWLFLFALLTAEPETYNIIAELCGF